MKTQNLVLFTFLALFTMVSSCKKDDDTTNNNNNNTSNPLSTALGGSPNIPTDAAGALYAVNNYVIADDGTGYIDTTQIGSTYAWFESYVNTKDAGIVSCNTDELTNSLNGTALPWYYLLGYTDFSGSNSAAWSVAGNSNNSIAGFTHTDNTAFPKCNFAVPANININNSLTINSTNQGANDAVFFTIYGYNTPKVTKSMPANATSATFTSAELKSVVASGGQIGIQVMPVKITPVTLGGKKYYFVKQWAFAQFSIAQ